MANHPLQPAQATNEVRRILRCGGEVRFTAEVDADNESPRDWAHDVADDEVFECLKKGAVNQAADLNLKYDEWTYRMEYRYDIFMLIVVVAILTSENYIRVITRFKKKQQFDRSKPKRKARRD